MYDILKKMKKFEYNKEEKKQFFIELKKRNVDPKEFFKVYNKNRSIIALGKEQYILW